jgi:hypothetical protein
MTKIRLLAVVTLIGIVATPAFAHHSVAASHDTSRFGTIAGTVAKVDWTNPHVWITLTVTKPNGDVVTERVEIAAPGRLGKIGFNANLLKIGDLVTVEAWMPKNDPRFAASAPNGRTLSLPDGRRFDVGDVWPDH